MGLADTSWFSTIWELTTQPSDNEKGRDVHRWWGSVRPREGKEIDFKMESGKLKCSNNQRSSVGPVEWSKTFCESAFYSCWEGRATREYRRGKTGEEFLYPEIPLLFPINENICITYICITNQFHRTPFSCILFIPFLSRLQAPGHLFQPH